jgi:hypothetical protein
MKPPPVALDRHTLAKPAGGIRSLSTRESETLNLVT